MNDILLDMAEEIFDSESLNAELCNTGNALRVFRQALQNGSQRLESWFQDGHDIVQLVYGRAHLVDHLLIKAWELFIPPEKEAALVAVGGYGRGELHPASDIDILVLTGSAPGTDLPEAIEKLLTFLWDIGLEVGHSVRTLEHCRTAAVGDITVVTNLVEARLITGSPVLFQRMRELTGPQQIWPSKPFFEAKRREQQNRHHKFDDTAYRLEPNIKGSPGGLRDIQMVGWVAKRHFGVETMRELVPLGFLTEQEYLTLMDGQSFLWRIRFALHIHNRRQEDRLLFDYQRLLAEQFGFQDTPSQLAVEQFMQQYYRTVMELGRLNEMLLQLFSEAILFPHQQVDTQVINHRFLARNGYLEVSHPRVFQQHPHALLEVFLLLETHPELQGVRASTIRLIREHRHLIDDHFRSSIAARSLFMEILRQPSGVTHALRRMNRYGILAAYVPKFANIVGRMQYDLFHVYTVDEHTLFVIRNLRRFMVPQFKDEFPLCSRISGTIPKPELLFIAALFHDIAKGRGGDHSILGAKDALAFCQKHELSNPDSRLVAWLVEKHLVMSLTAQRKDISDPEVIQAFAEVVADPIRLDYLYLLTVADSRATNPERWNSWRGALLEQLYTSTHRALLRGLFNPQAQDEVIQVKQVEALRILEQRGVDTSQVMRLWLNLNLEYFLHNYPDEIAWHAEVVLQATGSSLPEIHVRPRTIRGGTEVFIYAPDHDGLFAITTALLDQLGLNIMDARIITADDGFTLNSFLVLDEGGTPVMDSLREQEIVHQLEAGLSDPDSFEHRVSRRVPRRLKYFSTTTEANFSPDSPNHRTILRLVTADRPGLLAQVGKAFADCGIRLQNAKISTIGAEVEDIFFITDRENCPLNKANMSCLEEALHRHIDSSVPGSTIS